VEGWISLSLAVGFFKLVKGGNKGFGHKSATKLTEIWAFDVSKVSLLAHLLIKP
jgi:hypothetical protein